MTKNVIIGDKIMTSCPRPRLSPNVTVPSAVFAASSRTSSIFDVEVLARDQRSADRSALQITSGNINVGGGGGESPPGVTGTEVMSRASITPRQLLYRTRYYMENG